MAGRNTPHASDEKPSSHALALRANLRKGQPLLLAASSGSQESAIAVLEIGGWIIGGVLLLAIAGFGLMAIFSAVWFPLKNLGWGVVVCYPITAGLATLISAALIPTFSIALMVGLGTGLVLTLVIGANFEPEPRKRKIEPEPRKRQIKSTLTPFESGKAPYYRDWG